MSGSAIPASQIVNVVPSVLNAGGVGLDLNGMIVTTDNHIPINQVLSFPNLTAVQQFFGPTSYLSMLAATYFLADTTATKRPGALLMTCYSWQWLPAWTRSAQLPGLTIQQLNAITNSTIQITIGGRVRTSATISLSSATSFSDAAFRIGAAIHPTDATDGNPNPGYSPQTSNYVGNMTVTCSGTTMTVSVNAPPGAPSSTTQNTINPGDLISGPGWPVNNYVVARLNSPNGLTGTFQMAIPHNQATAQVVKMFRNPCSWDAATFQFMIQGPNANLKTGQLNPTISYVTSLSGNMCQVLKLSQPYGATIQPMGTVNNNNGTGFQMVSGAAFMSNVLTITQNWASFMLAFECDGVVNGLIQNVQKQAFAAWANSQNNNYMFCCWDTDPNALGAPGSPASNASLGRILNTSLTSGTACIYSPNGTNGRNLAAFLMGVVASIDFDRLNGRKTLAFRNQTGITPDITNGTQAANLEANFYNYYGIWTTANDLFRFLYAGRVSGPYTWIDSYVNQIWMNNNFQLALMDLLVSTGSIPYNQAGYTLIKAACQDVINSAMTFGAIRAGVTLSQAQVAEVNFMAGVQIDGVLSTRGYYLQVLDAAPEVREARGSPPCTFWYMDGGSVQRLTLASVMVQ